MNRNEKKNFLSSDMNAWREEEKQIGGQPQTIL